jgi:hypothetical protein
MTKIAPLLHARCPDQKCEAEKSLMQKAPDLSELPVYITPNLVHHIVKFIWNVCGVRY